jgi:hypothetical protein
VKELLYSDSNGTLQIILNLFFFDSYALFCAYIVCVGVFADTHRALWTDARVALSIGVRDFAQITADACLRQAG